MKFTNAIRIYGAITNDGGKSGMYYTIGADNEIIEVKDEDSIRIITDVFEIADLMTCDTWEGNNINKQLKLPEREIDVWYYYIDEYNFVISDIDSDINADKKIYDIYNYFKEEEMAQYIADSQLIYRIVLTLEVLNKDIEPCKLNELIDEFLEENYGDVLNRIAEYERTHNL